MSSLLLLSLVILYLTYVSSTIGPSGPQFDVRRSSMNKMGALVGEAPLYLLKFILKCDKKGSRDVVGTAASINHILCSNTNYAGTKCIYKYKVMGEARFVVVMTVIDTIQLEKKLADISRRGCIDITTEPLSSHENIWMNRGIEPAYLQPTPNVIDGINELTWCTYRAGYAGMTLKQFQKLAANEARSTFTYRQNGIPLNIFKIQGQPRNELFIKMSVPDFEVELMNTPMFKKNGHNVKLGCCGILELDYFLQRMSNKY